MGDESTVALCKAIKAITLLREEVFIVHFAVFSESAEEAFVGETSPEELGIKFKAVDAHPRAIVGVEVRVVTDSAARGLIRINVD